MSKEATIFEFHSGGAYHFQGFGEWIVSLESEGRFAIQHNVRGEIKDYGSHSLSPIQADTLWELIQGIDFEVLIESKRMGVPDEARYGFSLRDETADRRVAVWAGEALAQPAIVTLLEQTAAIIEKVTGIKPMLK